MSRQPQPPNSTPPGARRRTSASGPRRSATRHRPLSAGRALLVMVIAFTLAGLLTGADLRARADGMDTGFWRSAALVGIRPLAATGASLGLDRPLRLVGEWRRTGGDALVTTGAAVPDTTTLAGAASTSTTGTTAGTVESGVATTAAPTTTTTVPDAQNASRVASADHPLKVWVGGDSMVEQVGQALTNRGDKSGLLDVRTDFKISSGLCRPDFFNWPAVIADVAATRPPDISVVMFGGNDYQDLKVDGKGTAPFTPAWTKEYERRVAGVIQTLTADGGRLYWLGVPVMRDHQLSVRAAALDKLYRRVVERFPTATYVDTWELLSDPKGGYTAYRANAAGVVEKVREPDGEHMTYLGGDHIAAFLIADLKERGALPSK